MMANAHFFMILRKHVLCWNSSMWPLQSVVMGKPWQEEVVLKKNINHDLTNVINRWKCQIHYLCFIWFFQHASLYKLHFILDHLFYNKYETNTKYKCTCADTHEQLLAFFWCFSNLIECKVILGYGITSHCGVAFSNSICKFSGILAQHGDLQFV